MPISAALESFAGIPVLTISAIRASNSPAEPILGRASSAAKSTFSELAAGQPRCNGRISRSGDRLRLAGMAADFRRTHSFLCLHESF